MSIVNQGGSIGRQVAKEGGPVSENIDTDVSVQVCLSGRIVNRGSTRIGKRYVPPGSTCVILDDPTVVVDEVLHQHPPVPGPIPGVTMRGTAAADVVHIESGSMSFRFD